MDLLQLGISYKTAPIHIREKVVVPLKELPALMSTVPKKCVSELVIVSTCNRLEVYAFNEEKDDQLLLDIICKNIKPDELSPFTYRNTGESAIRHLCGVASGLDSMVLGEPQIFGQVKDSFRVACESGTVGQAFNQLFPQVFSIAKKVRSKTGIGKRNLSIGYAAVRKAQEKLGELHEKNVMILGAGEMGENTVRNLIAHGVSKVFVANRTYQKAVELAERFNGVPIMLHEIFEYIPKMDIIISSVGGESFVVSASNFPFANCQNKQIVIIDISVPRSIDPKLSECKEIFLYNIDDLTKVVQENGSMREEEAQKAWTIIEEKIPTIYANMFTHDIIPVITSIREKAEGIRRDSCLKLLSSEPPGSIEIAKIDNLTRSIVNRILHSTLTELREYSSQVHKGKV